MALTQALCTSFKVQLMQGAQNFDNPGGDTYKIALFRAQGSIVGTFGAATTNYSDMGADEVTGIGYTAGGNTLTAVSPTSSGTTAFIDFADTVWSNATLTASGALIYNDTQGGTAVAVLDFGGDKTATAADFTIIFPAAAAATAIIRLV